MKFSGKIGFAQTVEGTGERVGIWEDIIVEKHYYGDVLQNYRRWQASEDVNDDLAIDNKLSILADSYMMKNQFKMKYVVWNDCRLKISSIELNWPRVIISIGGIWNGNTV